MHQILCRLGLCPKHHWGSLRRSPDPLAVFRGLILRLGGKGKGRRGGKEGVGRVGGVREGELRPPPWGIDAPDVK